MKLRRITTVLSRTTAAVIAAAAALMVVAAAPAAGAAASPATASYALSATATMTPGTGTCLDCVPPSSAATGTAACSLCLPGKPDSATFTLDLPTITTYPPSPCKIKTVTGTLTATWDTGQTSTATVSGHYIDGKPILTLTGTFFPADPVYPTDPLSILLTNFPPQPVHRGDQHGHRRHDDRRALATPGLATPAGERSGRAAGGSPAQATRALPPGTLSP